MPQKYDIKPYNDLSREDGRLDLYDDPVKRTRTHGPGKRYSLWVQGCHKRCPGCVNEHMLDTDRPGNVQMAPEELVDDIVACTRNVLNIEGITIQGGEPFLQARNLAEFLRQLRSANPDLNVLIFTGYDYERLLELSETHPQILEVIEHADTIIDGEFEREAADREIIRGSRNQTLIHRTDRLKSRDFRRKGRETIYRPAEGVESVTGIKIKR